MRYESAGASQKSVFVIKGISVNPSAFSLELELVTGDRAPAFASCQEGNHSHRVSPNPNVDREQNLPPGFCEVKVKLLI